MPMREIREKFTKSELLIQAWRSQETAYNLRRASSGVQTPPRGSKSFLEAPRPLPEDSTSQSQPQNSDQNGDQYGVTDQELQKIEERLGPVAYKIEQEGEVNLRKMTGDEARRFLAAFGVPVFGGMRRKPNG